MNTTPKSSRIHIAFFGRRNAGKSSLINALCGQKISIVSSVPGTTADPVEKAMEILPLGPVNLIDTAGIDDEGELGSLRVEKTFKALPRTDVALLVLSPETGWGEPEEKLVAAFEAQKTGFIILWNKSDLNPVPPELKEALKKYEVLEVSARTQSNIQRLKGLIARKAPEFFEENSILGDLIQPGDTVMLVVPIDTGMPKNRLILPQVQTIRDILDHDAQAYMAKERELRWALNQLKTPPRLVVTDSHAFMKVDADTPKNIPLTSFSILFSRYKGELFSSVEGLKKLKTLKEGSKCSWPKPALIMPSPMIWAR